MKNTVKFAVLGDPHFEIVPNGEKMLDEFLRAAEAADVDFIIHMGDFSYPTDTYTCRCPIEKMPVNVKNAYGKPRSAETLALLQKYNAFKKPAYHCIGNHEFDFASVDEVVAAYGMQNNYYSFHLNNWHFIVLDGNYMKNSEGETEHFDHSQYFWQSLPWLPEDELEWLRRELCDTDEPTVIFSHEPLCEREGIKNHAEFLGLVNEARERGKDVRICINGHVHIDELRDIDGILYYGVNSMSNAWVDEPYETIRFSPEIEEKYPSVRYTIPYSRSVFSIVTVDDEGISVLGVDGDYIKPGPREIGYRGRISPSSESWQRSWKR